MAPSLDEVDLSATIEKAEYEARLADLQHSAPMLQFEVAATDAEENLARRAPVALREAKRAIRLGADLPLEDGLAIEQHAFDRTMYTHDALNSMRAYLNSNVLLGDMDFDFLDD